MVRIRRDLECVINWLIRRGVPCQSSHILLVRACDGLAESLLEANPSEDELIDEPGGEAVTMPLLIAAKARADKRSYLWRDSYDAYSEQDIGIDRGGRFVKAGGRVVVTVHGGGLLNYERLCAGISDAWGLPLLEKCGFVTYDDEEFDELLDGRLPDGKPLELYTVKEIRRGIPNPFGRYAVVLGYNNVRNSFHNCPEDSKKNFVTNPLILARAGTQEFLEDFYDKVTMKESEFSISTEIIQDKSAVFSSPSDSLLPHGSILRLYQDSPGYNCRIEDWCVNRHGCFIRMPHRKNEEGHDRQSLPTD